MNIEQLKAKYKQILEEPELNSDDDEDKENSYRMMTRNRKKKILTEITMNDHYQVSQRHPKNQDKSQVVLNLKQKIGQLLHQIHQKDDQINASNQQIIQLKIQSKYSEEINNGLKDQIKALQKQKIEDKVQNSNLIQMLNKIQKEMQEWEIDKQLREKQLEFYKKEISEFKRREKKGKKRQSTIEDQIRVVQFIKNQNERLQSDIKRLHIIFNDIYHEEKLVENIKNKNYLGKPYKEGDCWYPTNLVGEVQVFLKKEQVGYGNKTFHNNLVKFIDKYIDRFSLKDKEQPSKKIKPNRGFSQLKKSEMSNKNKIRSSSLFQMVNSTIKRSQFLGNSLLKKDLNSVNVGNFNLHDSKKGATETLEFQKMQKSLMIQKQHQNSFHEKSEKQVCKQILSEFTRVANDLMNEKDIKRNKIKRVIEEMMSCMTEVLDPSQSKYQTLEASKSKIKIRQ